MSETLSRPVADPALSAIQNALCDALRTAFQATSAESTLVQPGHSGPFEFKSIKASLPGDVILATAALSGRGAKFILCFDRQAESALNTSLGETDQTPAKSESQLEPLRSLLSQIITNTLGLLADESGIHLGVEELRCVALDLTPSDFPSAGASMGNCTFQRGADSQIWFVASHELLNAVGSSTTTPGIVEEKGDEDHDGTDSAVDDIGLVLDIELGVTIELGRTNMLIRDIVKLAPGSIVELDKLSGEPVDLYVNGRRFARGEVVVIDENFAVRITELISPAERLAANRN